MKIEKKIFLTLRSKQLILKHPFRQISSCLSVAITSNHSLSLLSHISHTRDIWE